MIDQDTLATGLEAGTLSIADLGGRFAAAAETAERLDEEVTDLLVARGMGAVFQQNPGDGADDRGPTPGMVIHGTPGADDFRFGEEEGEPVSGSDGARMIAGFDPEEDRICFEPGAGAGDAPEVDVFDGKALPAKGAAVETAGGIGVYEYEWTQGSGSVVHYDADGDGRVSDGDHVVVLSEPAPEDIDPDSIMFCGHDNDSAGAGGDHPGDDGGDQPRNGGGQPGNGGGNQPGNGGGGQPGNGGGGQPGGGDGGGQHLRGGPEADELSGGPEDDVIEGGDDADCLEGGAGDDVFVFRNLAEQRAGRPVRFEPDSDRREPDVIEDFDTEDDVIRFEEDQRGDFWHRPDGPGDYRHINRDMPGQGQATGNDEDGITFYTWSDGAKSGTTVHYDTDGDGIVSDGDHVIHLDGVDPADPGPENFEFA